MLLLLAILLLLGAPILMIGIRILRPGFVYYWLIAGFTVLFAWPLVLLSGFHLPATIPLMTWQPSSLFPVSPFLTLDLISWSFALALTSVETAVILTAVARSQPPDWRAWAGSLFLTGLGIVAVAAGNPLTLLLGWASLDLVELAILVVQVNQSEIRERGVVAFSARIVGIVLLLSAIMVGSWNGENFSFTQISTQASLLLLLAAGLRLGVIPLHVPFLQEIPLRRGLGTTLRLAPAAASLMVLARTAGFGRPSPFIPLLLLLASLTALYGAWAWASSSDELNGRPFWILCTASFTVVSALRGMPSASLSWGIACLLSGGLIFLASIQQRNMAWIPWLGLIGFSALPFTPNWSGLELFALPAQPGLDFFILILILFLAVALLLTGYARHLLRTQIPYSGVERWVHLIYPIGLFLLPVTHWVIGIRSGLSLHPLSSSSWWGPFITLILCSVIWVLAQRGPHLPQFGVAALRQILSLDWLYRLFWRIYRTTGRLVAWISLILEGEGGLLWALVLLTLVLSLLAQSRSGG